MVYQLKLYFIRDNNRIWLLPICDQAIWPPFTTSSGLEPNSAGFHSTKSASFPTWESMINIKTILVIRVIEKWVNQSGNGLLPWARRQTKLQAKNLFSHSPIHTFNAYIINLPYFICLYLNAWFPNFYWLEGACQVLTKWKNILSYMETCPSVSTKSS